jgi:hypothetical protein
MKPSPTPRTIAFILLALVPWSGVGCVSEFRRLDEIPSTATKSFAGRQSECRPQFPDHNGWYGADAAYSVPLPIGEERSSLWLFGDSFVRPPNGPQGRAYPFVHNSIGISHCNPGGNWSLDTFWRLDERGTPRAFFEPDSDEDWVRQATQRTGTRPYYWPLDGFVLNDALFVGLLRVVHSEPRGAFNLPFQLVGVDLARISNYQDAPEDWRIQISILSNDVLGFPGSAFVATGSHLLAFAFLDGEGGRTSRMLSRLDLEALARWQPDLSGSLEYLAADSKWKPGFDPRDAKILMDDDASEMSVHFDAETNNWVAVYSDLARHSGTRSPTDIRIRTSPTLEGPWSKPGKLISIPETISKHPQNIDENLFCYAGKAHPQFSIPGELLVTYVCNFFAKDPTETLMILEKLRTRVDLYRPRALPVTMPESFQSGSRSE